MPGIATLVVMTRKDQSIPALASSWGGLHVAAHAVDPLKDPTGADMLAEVVLLLQTTLFVSSLAVIAIIEFKMWRVDADTSWFVER